jgi:cell division protein FtsZ
MQQAINGIEEMRPYVDTLVIIPNDKLLEIIGTNTTYLEAFSEADNVLRRGVQGISDIINLPGLINVDFADVRTVLKNKGTALMGIGIASGPNRAVEAAREAIQSPLLEVDINGATDAIVQITCDKDMTMREVEEIVAEIRNASSSEIEIIQGAAFNLDLNGEVIVTVIATGFDKVKKEGNENPTTTPSPKAPKEPEPQVSGGGTNDEEPNPRETKVPSWLQNRFR